MKVKLFYALSILFPFALAANGPTGQLMLNNDTQWHLLIAYKDSQGKVQTKQMAPTEQWAQIPVAGVYKNNFITVEHNNRLYNPMTAPAKNDGKTILAAVSKDKDKLNDSNFMIVDISLVKNNFHFTFSIKTKEKVNEEIQKAQAALPGGKKYSEEELSQMEKSFELMKIDKEERAALEAIPAEYRNIIRAHAKQILKTDAQLQNFFIKYYVSDELHKRVPLYAPLSLIALVYRFETQINPPGSSTILFYSKDLMQGKRRDTEAKSSDKPLLQEYDKTKNKALIPVMVGGYKIHLMPKKEDLIETVIMLVQALNNDAELRKLIAAFKVIGSNAPYEQAKKGNHLEQNAVIVIYPAEGKENAQKALNKIYELYKPVDKEYGMNVRPRYNAKVTDLIWIAQGDGQIKGGSWGEYYEEPDRIYYNPKAFGLSGDFHLKHPETGKDLVAIK